MWFTASLFFRSDRPEPAAGPLWEERLVVIEAVDEEAAGSEALRIGREGESAFVSATGERISWTFIRVERIHPIDGGAPVSGTEVFSRFLRHSEAESLLTPFED